MQVFQSSETPSSALYRLIRSYTKIFALFFGYLLDFSYLCSINQNIKAMSQKSNLGRPGEVLGRTELAQLYFPYILPKSAWEKLKALLLEDPALAPLATLRRRTFLPSEVAKIYASLGHP